MAIPCQSKPIPVPFLANPEPILGHSAMAGCHSLALLEEWRLAMAAAMAAANGSKGSSNGSNGRYLMAGRLREWQGGAQEWQAAPLPEWHPGRAGQKGSRNGSKGRQLLAPGNGRKGRRCHSGIAIGPLLMASQWQAGRQGNGRQGNGSWQWHLEWHLAIAASHSGPAHRWH